jgi:hypothetical protein
MKDLSSIVVGNYGMTYPKTGFLTRCHIAIGVFLTELVPKRLKWKTGRSPVNEISHVGE